MENKNHTMLQRGITLLTVIIGNAMYAAVAVLFLLPSGLPTGGTTGIALLVHRLTGISVSMFVLGFNIVMLVVGLVFLGKKFALTTIVSTFTYPICLELFGQIFANLHLTDDMWLNTLFSGLGIGIGLGIVIRMGASTGGMDIPPLILNKYLKVPVSLSLNAFDICILPTGGTTGIALLVHRLTGISVSMFVLGFNIVMLVVGLVFLGKKFALTTIVSTFTYPICLELFGQIFANLHLTDDMWLNTLFSGLGIGIGLGIVIRMGASTGGMDIPPLILNKYLKVPVSLSLNAFDICILFGQAILIPPEMLLYGIILVIIYTTVLNKVLLFGGSKMEVKIISSNPEPIRRAIIGHLDRGLTILRAEGGYSQEDRQVLLVVVSNRELHPLERIVKNIDPESFVIVSEVREVSGRGFSLKKEHKSLQSIVDGADEK